MKPVRVLISGGGIAGLTLAIRLKQNGFEPLVIEREPALRREGYMMDFFGTGWDVAERMDLVDELRAVRYPIDALEFVDAQGEPYMHMPIDRLRRALDNKYVYLRRQDLEEILSRRARAVGVEVRYGTSLAALNDRGDTVVARFEDGSVNSFALVVGADGVHSRVRELVFGPQDQFAIFLGLHVAAFHIAGGDLPFVPAARIYEEPDRLIMVYALDDTRFDATFVLRHANLHLHQGERLAFLQEAFRDTGWLAPKILSACDSETPIYLDSVTQISMPNWHRGRVALIGDACGCLTLLAGQGSHMAMTGGYVLAEALARDDDYADAFAAYQDFLKPHVDSKRRHAARFAGLFVPTARSWPWLRRLAIRLLFSRLLIGAGMHAFGTTSVLRGRA